MGISAEDVTVIGSGNMRACFARMADGNGIRRGHAFPVEEGKPMSFQADVLLYFEGIVSPEEFHYKAARQRVCLEHAGPATKSFHILVGKRHWQRLGGTAELGEQGGFRWRELPRQWHFAGCHRRRIAPWVRWGAALRVSETSRWVSLATSSHLAFVERDDVEFIVNADWLSSSCCEIVKIPGLVCLFPFWGR